MPQPINYKLKNGLRIVIQPVPTAQKVVCNLIYQVGSRDDPPQQGGMAHLVEHLMFSTKKEGEGFDQILQQAGGSNNAWTNADYTNYYSILPKENIELALWLEAERMANPPYHEASLRIQQKVVIEEFKQTVLNPPYGDAWGYIIEMIYGKSHPYGHNVIGRSFEEIQGIDLLAINQFVDRYYNPHNAVLAIAGGVEVEKVKPLIAHYFNLIPQSPYSSPDYPLTPSLTHSKKKEVMGNVPLKRYYRAYLVGAKQELDTLGIELIADLLGGGESSLLYRTLVAEKKLLSGVHCYFVDYLQAGILLIEGSMMDSTTFTQVEGAIDQIIDKLCQDLLPPSSLARAVNQRATSFFMEQESIPTLATQRAIGTLLGNPCYEENQMKQIANWTNEKIQGVAQKWLRRSHATLYYHKQNHKQNERSTIY